VRVEHVDGVVRAISEIIFSAVGIDEADVELAQSVAGDLNRGEAAGLRRRGRPGALAGRRGGATPALASDATASSDAVNTDAGIAPCKSLSGIYSS